MKKVCCVCKEEKDTSEFHRSSLRKDNCQGACKECYKSHYHKTQKRRKYQKKYYKKRKNIVAKVSDKPRVLISLGFSLFGMGASFQVKKGV